MIDRNQEFGIRNGGIAGAIGLACMISIGSAEPLPVADLKRTEPVNFATEVYPFLKANCLACHNSTKSKADLILESPKDMIKGGDSGPAVNPGDGENSFLFTTAAHIEEPTMPPANNKSKAKNLDPNQLALLKLWIDQGAKGDAVATAAPTQWTQLSGPQPIYTSSISADGRFAAAGRGQQIHIYDLKLGRLATTLKDGSITYPAAHQDLVHAIAFSPEGQLASGGYRVAKIWERSGAIAGTPVALPNDPAAVAVSPDRKWLAAGSADGTISLLALGSAESKPVPVKDHGGAVAGLAFTPDNASLISVSADKTIRKRAVADPAKSVKLDLPAPANAVAVIDSGKKVAVGCADNTIRVAEIARIGAPPPVPAKPAEGQPAPPTPAPPAPPFIELKVHTQPVTAMAAAKPDGSEFLSASADGQLIHWKTVDHSQIRKVAHGAPIAFLAVTADGARAATAGQEGGVKIWNMADGQMLGEAKGDPEIAPKAAELTRAAAVATRLKAHWDRQAPLAEKRWQDETEKAKQAAEAIAKARREIVAKRAEFARAEAAHPKSVAEDHDKAVAAAETAAKTVETATANQAAVAATVKPATDKAAVATAAHKAATDKVTAAATALKTATDKATVAAAAEKAATEKVAAMVAALKTATEKAAAATAALKAATDKAAAETAPLTTARVAAEKATASASAGKTAAEKTAAAAAIAKTESKKASDAAAARAAAEKTPEAQAAAKAAADTAAAAATAAKMAYDTAAAAAKDHEASAAKLTAAAAAEKTALDKVKAATANLAAAKAAGDKAVVDTTAAKAAADKALAPAQAAKIEADKVATAANTAKVEADKVLATATTAKTAADKAVADANAKKAAADKALADANTAKAAADKAVTTTKAAKDAADKALNEAKDALVKTERDLSGAERNRDLSIRLAGDALAEQTGALAHSKEAEATDVALKAEIETLNKSIPEVEKTIKTAGIAFSPDGATLAQALPDGTVRLWAAENGTWLENFPAGGETLAIIFTGADQLIAAKKDKNVVSWTLPGTSWSLARTIGDGVQPDPFSDRVTALAFNPGGTRLVTGTGVPSRSGQLKLWDTASWSTVAENDEAHEDTITSFTFGPFGKQLASGSTDRMVKVFEASTLEYRKTFEGHTSHVLDVDWNTDGLTIASASADKQVKIWDVAEGQQKQKIEGYEKEITSVEYVADATTLLTASGDKTLKLNNSPLPETGDTFLHTCAASPDGTIIIAGGQDGVLRIWDAATRKLIRSFQSPEAEAAKVAAE